MKKAGGFVFMRVSRRYLLALISYALNAMVVIPIAVQALPLQQQTLVLGGQQYSVNVPTGYVFELITTDIDSPRMLTFHPEGSLFAGSRSGKVYRIAPPYSKTQVLNKRFRYPHSVAFRDGKIFVASAEGLYSGNYMTADPLRISNLKKNISLPERGHNSRTVKIGPDNRVYISLGISGNCSNEYLGVGYALSAQRGGVIVLDEADAPTWKVYSSGLRNPVGFDWSPDSGELYASNNGPDHWGFEQPPEQFTHLSEGSFHGMPWYQYDGSQVIRDPCISVSPPRPVTDVQKPVAIFPARNAPMAVTFVPDDNVFGALSGNALVALHGSWTTRYGGDKASRRPPKLVMVRFEQGKAVGVEDVITGFQMANGARWARPTGIAIGPDNAIYIASDGEPSAVFRLRKALSE
jgi:glucose/arabinose dehydrogenase